MSNYTKATNFTAKDSLPAGDPSKVVMGSEIDDEFDAIQTAVGTKSDTTAVVLIDGTATMTGNLQMGAGQGVLFEGTTADDYETRLTGGEPTADRTITLPDLSGEVVVAPRLQAQTYTAYTTGGTNTAYTLTPSPALTALAENQEFDVEFNAAAGATPTLAISGLTAKNLKYRDSTGAKQAVTSTQIPSGWRSKVTYDGTDYIVREVPPVADSGGITLMTPVATTSGTSHDFTGIPAGTKRITINFAGVSVNGSDEILIQLGDAGGFETTGYTGIGTRTSGADTSTVAYTTGFGVGTSGGDTEALHGTSVLNLLSASAFTWCATGILADPDEFYSTIGSKSLSAELTQVRITTVLGVVTFDAGALNVSYE